MEQFSQNEIGVDSDGWQYFVDGWGSPILFLRWAPGFSNQYTSPLGFTGPSDIQTGNATTDHDPFDPRNIDNGQGGLPNAFQLFPLIYSSRGFQVANAPILFIGGTSYQYAGNPYQAFPDSVSGKNLLLGTPTGVFANVHNHHIEQR
jgi:hypothetical protein